MEKLQWSSIKKNGLEQSKNHPPSPAKDYKWYISVWHNRQSVGSVHQCTMRSSVRCHHRSAVRRTRGSLHHEDTTNRRFVGSEDLCTMRSPPIDGPSEQRIIAPWGHHQSTVRRTRGSLQHEVISDRRSVGPEDHCTMRSSVSLWHQAGCFSWISSIMELSW